MCLINDLWLAWRRGGCKNKLQISQGLSLQRGLDMIYVTITIKQNTDWKPPGDVFYLSIKNLLANNTTQKMNRQPWAVESSLSLNLLYWQVLAFTWSFEARIQACKWVNSLDYCLESVIHPFIHSTNIYWTPGIASGAQWISTKQVQPCNHTQSKALCWVMNKTDMASDL